MISIKERKPPEKREGRIDLALRKVTSRGKGWRMLVDPQGQASITDYRVLAETDGLCLIECHPRTGRTHQIRVHLASIGHPVLGDRLYGAGFATKAARLPGSQRALVEAFPRQALHAWLLGFEHPVTGETPRFESDPPADMAALIDALGTI